MIFLTGASGLIGSFIARKLTEQGLSVRALRRNNTDLSLLSDISDKIEWIEGDILDISLMKDAVKGAEWVIHSAAVISYDRTERQLMYKINTEGTANVVNASLASGVPNFCMISSVAAIGKDPASERVHEDLMYNTAFRTTTTHYGMTKHLAEMEVYRGFQEGLQGFLVNPSVVLGPGDWNRGSTRLFKYVFDKNLFYSLGKVNHIDVRDVAEIVFQLMKKGEKISEKRFILNCGQVSYRQLFNHIAECFSVRKPLFKAGNFLSEIAWRVESAKSLVTGKEPVVTRESARLAKSRFYYDNTKICTLLDYRFIPLHETLSWTCNVLKERYKLN